MKNYNLFLDDVRVPADCVSYTKNPIYETIEWVTVRSFNEFVNVIMNRYENDEFPELISFDHDLAAEHYHPTMYAGIVAYNEVSNQFEESTGKECADWLVQFCIDQELALPVCLIHSMNPAGVQRIKLSLEDHAKYIKRFG